MENQEKQIPKLPQSQTVSKEVQEKLDIINKANECNVLMSLLCEKLDLQPHQTTHQQFVERFSQVMKSKIEAEKYMQEMFISAQPTKTRKKRTAKTVSLKQ